MTAEAAPEAAENLLIEEETTCLEDAAAPASKVAEAVVDEALSAAHKAAHGDETTVPVAEAAAPGAPAAAPATEVAVAAEAATTHSEEEAQRVQEAVASVSQAVTAVVEVSPAEEETAPAEEEVTPVEEAAAPASDVAVAYTTDSSLVEKEVARMADVLHATPALDVASCYDVASEAAAGLFLCVRVCVCVCASFSLLCAWLCLFFLCVPQSILL